MKHIIGFDGGGTKTEAVLADQTGTEAVSLIGSSTNVKAVGLSNALDVISHLLDEFYNKHSLLAEDCIGVCLGLAGTEQSSERSAFAEHVRKYYHARGHSDVFVRVTNDAEIALAATYEENHGVIAISGTGAIVFGLTPSGAYFRTGGWGHLLGDKGSGYEIGLQALQAVMLSYDGVLAPTSLTELILNKLNLSSPPELRTTFYEPHIEKKHIADVAESCLQAAARDDTVALDIVTRAAQDLAALTAALRRKDASFAEAPQGVTGSIFKNSPLFRTLYSERLQQLVGPVSIVLADQRPVYGAIKLALKAEEVSS
ncbi:MAG: hypothetical protein K0Q59_2605 [Paenibacillus sp.]|nr:hypothetical protein [Paenibacillus sp.]